MFRFFQYARGYRCRIVVFFIFLLFATVAISNEKGDSSSDKMSREIAVLVNKHRKSLGLTTLVESEVIAREARQHSARMAEGKVEFGNHDFNKRTAAIKAEIGGKGFSENVAIGSISAQAAIESWLASAGHKKNIEGDFSHIGVGVARSRNGTLYFTQIFAKIEPNEIISLTDEIAAKLEADIVKLVNNHRAQLGLRPLKTSKAITLPSKLHSENMARGIVRFGHEGFEKRSEGIKKTIGGTGFAENLAFGQTTAASVVEAWLNSQGHRKNIEGDFTHVGIGIAKSESGTLFYTQIFVNLN